MVDIHSHVLPGLDDGARTIDESIEMIKLAAASGTTDLVATPHASSAYPFDELRVQHVFRDMSARAKGLLTLHWGCDFHLNIQNLQDALVNPTKYTVNHGPYLMVELPDFVGLSIVTQQLQALLHARICPIITHPERNVQLQSASDQLKSWVAAGCLLQITAQSFFGRFGETARSMAERLMNGRLVHCIASDAHDCTSRPPDLSSVFKLVESRWGRSTAEKLLIHNPQNVISGEIIKLTSSRSRWYSFFSFFRK